MTAVALAVVILAEMGVRTIADRLPVPLVWHNQEALVRVEYMKAAGDTDIVFAGSSLAGMAFDPALVEELLPGVSAHNAAQSAGLPSLTTPWTLDVVLPRLEPELLVLGVGSFDFYDHSAATAFRDAFLNSTGGRHATDPTDTLASLDWWLGARSDLWRHRRELRQPKVLLQALRNQAERLDVLAARVQPTGWSTFEGTPRFDSQGPDADAGLPNQEWTLGTREPAMIETLISEARERSVEVVLALMPTTEAYVRRHPRQELDHDLYVAAASELAKRMAVPLIRLDHVRDDALFGDSVHLNREGAHVTTAMVVDELVERDLVDVRTGSR